MVRKKRLFIASSKEAKRLAEGLKRYIDDSGDPIETIPWYDPAAFPPSDETLSDLLSHCERCDFAVALLTADDMTKRREKDLQAPRDNVIFELGLFMGALGLEPARCFMVSGVNKEALPSDLRGRHYIQITQPPNLEDREECRKAVTNAGAAILERIQKLQCYERPKLSMIASSTLADMEQARHKGGNLWIQPGVIAVVVNSVEPLEETDAQFAKNVMDNLKAGAKYEYFWGHFEENYFKTANFIQTLSLAGLAEPIPDDRVRFIQSHLKEVRSNLKWMQTQLSIHFRKRPPLQFCVHNALSEEHAVCYLRHDSDFVRWTGGRSAKEVSDELTSSCKTVKKGNSIFHSTADFKLTKDGGDNADGPAILARQDELMTLLRERFPNQLHKELEVICFGR